MKGTKIYCCGCERDRYPRLTTGKEIYPHRKDLYVLPFWKCDDCGNYVGCHHKSKKPTTPLGVIPTAKLRSARNHIHKILDPIWRTGMMSRTALYAEISERLGYAYHTAQIRSVEEAREVYRVIQAIRRWRVELDAVREDKRRTKAIDKLG